MMKQKPAGALPKPKLGQIVFYRAGDKEHGKSTQPRINPAIVTNVGDEGCLNLIVFFDGVAPVVRRSVKRFSSMLESGWLLQV